MANKKDYLWPDNHYGQRNRKLMTELRGELHLGEDGPQDHEEYIVSDAALPELEGQQSNKNPTKGNSKA